VKSKIANSSSTLTYFGVRPPRMTLSEFAMISTPPPLRQGLEGVAAAWPLPHHESCGSCTQLPGD
jgi:hypothetical protein